MAIRCIRAIGSAAAAMTLGGSLLLGGTTAQGTPAATALVVPTPAAPTPPAPPKAPVVPQPQAPSAPSAGANAGGSAAPPRPAAAASCPSGAVSLPLGARARAQDKLRLPAGETRYEMQGQAARVTRQGLIVPLKAGRATLKLSVTPPGGARAAAAYSCTVPVTIAAGAAPKLAFAPKAESRSVKIGAKTFAVEYLHLPKGTPTDVGLAQDHIGGLESLEAIAKRSRAQSAVNGTFFESYGGIPEPWGNLIADGEVEHIGNYGTTIGFGLDGTVKMDSLRVTASGESAAEGGRTKRWYAYFINRTPGDSGDSAILYTPRRGARIGFARGTAVVVDRGVVARIAKDENAAIPADGFVVVFTGSLQSQAEKFVVGGRASYETTFADASGKAVDWSGIVTAVGAGPRVVKDGKVAVDPKGEGFTQEKITSAAAARSGIGVLADGSVIVVATGGATVRELGAVMVKLGAVQAMNLDGGASSGVYADGKLRTKPGRLLGNALLFGQKLAFRA